MTAERTVAVNLTARVSQYVTGMRAAEAETRKFAGTGKDARDVLAKQNEAMSKAGVGMAAVGGAAALGLGLVLKASTEFGSKMAQLQSLSHATSGEMKQLGDAAMTAGQAYGFTASQVADAEIELTKAGIGVKAQLGGALKGALELAAAGQIDVGQATQIATVAMTQFGLKAGEVPHLADLLAAGADKALGSVGDLGAALSNGGLQAHNMGLTIDETVGTLAAFANAGIIGAEAGTQMRSMFIQIQKPSAKAKETMDQYGISMYDAQGKFIGMTALAGELQAKLGGLTQAQKNSALATIFGSYAINGASVLMELGSKKMAGWIKSVNDSGFASAQAAGKMNSLQGDVQKLSAAFQTDLIKAGTSADGAFRPVIQEVTGLVSAFGALPGPVQGGTVVVAALTAGVGLLGGAVLLAVPKILEFKLALASLGTSGLGVAKLFGAGGVVIAGVTDIIAAFAALGQHGTATAQQVEQAGIRIEQSWKGVDAAFGSAGSSLTSGKGLKAALDELGDGGAFSAGGSAKIFDSLTFGIAHLSDVYKANEGTFAAMGQQLGGLAKVNYSAATQSFNQLISKYKLSGDEIRNLLNSMPAYKEALVGIAGNAHVAATDQNLLSIAQGKGRASAMVVAAAQREAAAAAAKNSSALNTLAGRAGGATTSIKDLKAALDNLDGGQLSARAAARAFQKAIDDASAAVKANGRNLDINTEKGRNNQEALDAIASAAADDAKAYLNAGGSAKGAAAIMANGRGAFIRAAEAMGMSASAAKKLADRLFAIPKNTTPHVSLTGTGSALDQLAELERAVGRLNGKPATVRVHQVGTLANQGFAAGGAISGPGAKGVDSVPAMLAPGEHVLTDKDVDKLGGQAGVYRFRSALQSGLVQAFASGGAVTSAKQKVTWARQDLAYAQSRLKSATKAGKAARQHSVDLAKRRLITAEERLAALTGKTGSKSKAAVAAARKAAAKAAAERATVKAQAREDFVSTQRRATADNPIDPLSYVDQLRSMSRDTSGIYSSKQRKSFDAAANKYESTLVKLSDQSAKAAAKLKDLQDASTQMHDSIKSSIAGGYTLAGAATPTSRDVASGWVTRNGIRFQTTSTATSTLSAGSIADYYKAGAGTAGQFASALKQLAGKGINAALLAELAGMGTEQGLPIAQALLSASASQLRSINANYTAIGKFADSAGSLVADANYAKQIAAADAAADKITKQLASDGEKLRKLIASAFGLKGYAVGTSNAAPGLHWVGENGPELVGFNGGETVLTAARSRAWSYGSGRGSVQVTMPQSMNLIDADGQVIGRVRAEARDVAVREIHADAMSDAVLTYGGAA